MTNILFAGSDLGDFTVTAGTPTTTTSATYIDTAVSRAGVYMNGSLHGVRATFMASHSTGTLWVRFRYKHESASFGPYTFFSLFGGGGEILRIERPSALAGGILRVNDNGTMTSVGNAISIGSAAVFYDIKLILGSPHTAEFYANNTLVSSTTFANASLVNATHMDLSGERSNNAISEVMAIENLTTIGKRLAVRTPTGAGAYSDWTGTFAEVDEADLNDSDILTTETALAKSSFTMSTSTAIADRTVVGVVVSSRGKTDDITPKQSTHFLRIGGVDYEAATPSNFGLGYSTHQSAWVNDPATGSPFDPTVANGTGLEIGFKSS